MINTNNIDKSSAGSVSVFTVVFIPDTHCLPDAFIKAPLPWCCLSLSPTQPRYNSDSGCADTAGADRTNNALLPDISLLFSALRTVWGAGVSPVRPALEYWQAGCGTAAPRASCSGGYGGWTQNIRKYLTTRLALHCTSRTIFNWNIFNTFSAMCVVFYY